MTNTSQQPQQNNITIEAAKEYHNIQVESLRKLESIVIQLLGVLLPAVGGFAWALDKYLENPAKQWLFFTVAIAGILVMGWGLYYTIALSYVYRYLTIVLWAIEKRICLSSFTPDWDPDPECKYTNILYTFKIAPSALRVHAAILSVAILGLGIIYQFVPNSCYRNIVILTAVVVVVIALVLAHNIYPCKLKRGYLEVKSKMEEMDKNEKEKEEPKCPKVKETELKCCVVGIDWIDISILSLLILLGFIISPWIDIINKFFWITVFGIVFIFSCIQISRYCGLKNKWKKCCKKLTKNALWKRIKKLKGKIIYTIEEKEKNEIIDVTSNEIIIKDRQSRPTKDDIWRVYELLWIEKRLNKNNTPQDLFSDKKVARIIYAILAEAVPEQIKAVSQQESPDGLSGIMLREDC